MDRFGEQLTPRVKTEISPIFRIATDELKGGLKKQSGREQVDFDNVLKLVFDWEESYKDKVSNDEISALKIVYSVLDTVGLMAEDGNKITDQSKLAAIKMQQSVLRIVFSNLDTQGRPNAKVTRSLSLVADLFGDLLISDQTKITNWYLPRRAYTWQGMRGSLATALTFNKAGWRVFLPKPFLDLRHEVDLLVSRPEKGLFAVDITSRAQVFDNEIGEFPDPLSIERKPVSDKLNKVVPNLKGVFKINIPPPQTPGVDKYFENMLTGFPSELTMQRLEAVLPK